MSRTTELTLAKASPIGDDIRDAHIHITAELPDKLNSDEWIHLCEEQAIALEEALIECLPGGVYDHLAVRMLDRKASHYRIRHHQAVTPA